MSMARITIAPLCFSFAISFNRCNILWVYIFGIYICIWYVLSDVFYRLFEWHDEDLFAQALYSFASQDHNLIVDHCEGVRVPVWRFLSSHFYPIEGF